MDVCARGLDEDLAIPIDSQRAQLVDLALRGTGAHAIDVLDSQDKLPSGCARPQPREQRGAEVSQVQVAAR